MKKRKKIYYVPGIISLIFLPILFLIQNNHEIKKTRQYAIEYITPFEWDDYNYEIPAKRNYINVKLEGDTKNDSLHFLFIKNFAETIEQSKDTVIGLKIIFGSNIKYGTLISTLNCLLKAKIKTYIPIEDTLFVYYINRTDSCPECNIPNDWACFKLTYFIDDNRSFEEIRRDNWLKIKNNLIIHKYYWPIFLAYILLVIIATHKIINEFKEQTIK
jgi:hypothetical protein